MATRKFACSECRHAWEVGYGSQRPTICPKCNSVNVHRAEEDRGYARAGGGRRRGGPPWAR